ncbi:c-type cytochrome biogenesis protein CcmI [Defluviimonas salinarum]|uniref:C-type cytochrome biogenesis protein CcmI n=1 Tax=Defluviimonas salinarum TaxID=2992147 RepID=A0ABT3J052_9RHOB|nr:c-type cytochrome biogenesis protein CcmI [Defluviimonas salinarum]MCW3781050.1 c-type cytochrome biogenesis protein CcmI [Defluviimonas salinarum]
MLFWIVSLALSAAVGAALLRSLAQGGQTVSANADIGVYRDQLAEVERDLARGVVDAAEAERVRIEISRRILDSDRSAGPARVARGSVALPALGIAVALAGAFALYLSIGAPGYPDLPIGQRIERAAIFHEDRPSQAEAVETAQIPTPPTPEASYAELMERLRTAVAANPGDITGQRLLARNEAALGNHTAAAEAQARVIALAGDAATANDHATLADSYVLATGGYVSPEAEAALNEALRLDPGNPTARFYTGLMWAQTGRPDRAFQFWKALLEAGPEDAPWIAPIRAQIEMLAAAAGVRYTPPAPAASGPDAGDVAAAAGMSQEERLDMIRGMVDGLAERLSSEGGPAEDWARLITSLGVLGETERAKAVWTDAQSVFAGHEADLETVRAAARQAGVAE